MSLPHALRGYREEQYIHAPNQVGRREFRTNCLDSFWEDVILQEVWIPVVCVEVLDELCGTGPHEDIVRGVSEVVSQTAAKVSGTEDEDSCRLVFGRLPGLWHLKVSVLDDAGSKRARLETSSWLEAGFEANYTWVGE